MKLSRKHIIYTLGVPVSLNESIQFSKQLESIILYEQILYETFLVLIEKLRYVINQLQFLSLPDGWII